MTSKMITIYEVGSPDINLGMGDGPIETVEIQFDDLVPTIRSIEDAVGALKNQGEYLQNGKPCRHVETTHNGLGRYECLTCGRFFTQQANGHVPGLS